MTAIPNSLNAFNTKVQQAPPEQQGKASFRNVTVLNTPPLQRRGSIGDLSDSDKRVQRFHQGNMPGPFQNGGSTGSLECSLDPDMNASNGFTHVMGEDPDAGSSGVGRADYQEPLKRTHPLDPEGQSGPYNQQHAEDVQKILTPVLQNWDTEGPELHEPEGKTAALTPDAQPSKAQTAPSLVTREQCAREILKDMGVSLTRTNNLLQRQASSRGGTAVINACHLLAMPEVKANPVVRKALEGTLEKYLAAAKGDYSGVSRSFGPDAFSKLSKLNESVQEAFDTIGPATVRNRLLAVETDAVKAALARKNPEMSQDELRKYMPELFNPQIFAGWANRVEGADASGLLQDIPLLPQFAQAADNQKRPPADKAAEPVKDFVRNLRDVLSAMPMPIFYNDNSAKNVVNQDGWIFQGIKDPRPEKAAEPESPPTPIVPEVRALGSHPWEQIVEAVEDVIASSHAPVEEVITEEQEQVREDNSRRPPERDSSLHKAPVNPLHARLMGDLKKDPRYLAAQNTVTVQSPAPHVNSQNRNATDEDDTTRNKRVGSNGTTGHLHPTPKLTRLLTPIPLGLHADDVLGSRKNAKD